MKNVKLKKTPEEKLATDRLYARRYYYSTKGRIQRFKYQNSERFEEVRRVYRCTPQYKAYRKSEHHKASRRTWNATVIGRELRRQQRQRYYASLKGQEQLRQSRDRNWCSLAGRFTQYRNNARKRDIIFQLTRLQFAAFWGIPCTYCGDSIETIGLDRINNKEGYLLGNVRSCCTTCNYMKRMWSPQFFIAHCEKIVSHA